MSAIFISFIVIIAVIILLALIIGSRKKEEPESVPEFPHIHASGVYSVIRKSPREDVLKIRPDKNEIKKILSQKGKDSSGNPLTSSDIEKLCREWAEGIEENIKAVEEADELGRNNFLLERTPECVGCCNIGEGTGMMLSREDIYRHPELIPPYHPGCGCRIMSDVDWDSKKTVILAPLRQKEEGGYNLPQWDSVIINKQ
ncbi:MAG: hypothetical protein ACLFQK_10785 [Fibrobacterota bacterium]